MRYFSVVALVFKLIAQIEAGLSTYESGQPVTISDVHENLFGRKGQITITITPDPA